jgi:hypothetical protein
MVLRLTPETRCAMVFITRAASPLSRRNMMSDQKPDQPVQAEWEVVEPADARQAPPKASRTAMLRAMLGPWWRWKVASLMLALAVIAAFVFAMAGVMVIVGAVVLVVSLVVAKVRQMLRQSGNSLTR